MILRYVIRLYLRSLIVNVFSNTNTQTQVRALKVFTLGAIMAQNSRYREMNPRPAKKKKKKPPKMSTFRFKEDSKKMDELPEEEFKESIWDPEADGIGKNLKELVPLDGDEGFFGDVVSWFRPIVKKKKKKKKKKKAKEFR